MADSHIVSLTVKGFRSIRALENFRLTPGLNILIGGNGSGKSNFVSLFAFLRELVDGRLGIAVGLVDGAERLLYRGGKVTAAIEVDFFFPRNAYGVTLRPTANDALIFAREETAFLAPDGYTKQSAEHALGTGHTESRLRERVDPNVMSVESYVYRTMTAWTVYHFHDTTDAARRPMRRAPEQDRRFFRGHAENLAPFLLRLHAEEREDYEIIRQTIRLAVPSFDDFEFTVEENAKGDRSVLLTWKEVGHDYPLTLSQFSDGSLRFVCLTVALMQPRPPATIIIDEPELGLHPYALSLLAGMLRQTSKHTQIIVSTQSPQLLDEFDPGDIIVVDKVDGASTFTRLDADQLSQWLTDYSLGDIWRKNLIGGRPHS
jgi:predicted ATPase